MGSLCTNECWACLHSAQQAPKTPTPVTHIQQHRLFDGHYEQLIHLQVIGKEQTKQYTTQHQNTTEHMLELGSRVVSVLDSGTERPGFKLQPRRCRVTVLGKLFAPIVPLFTKQQNRRVYDSPPLQADCQVPGSAPEPYAWQSSMGYLYIFFTYARAVTHTACVSRTSAVKNWSEQSFTAARACCQQLAHLD